MLITPKDPASGKILYSGSFGRVIHLWCILLKRRIPTEGAQILPELKPNIFSLPLLEHQASKKARKQASALLLFLFLEKK
jgi:hypothetical protein